MASSFTEVRAVVSNLNYLIDRKQNDPKLNTSFNLINEMVEFSKKLDITFIIKFIKVCICICYLFCKLVHKNEYFLRREIFSAENTILLTPVLYLNSFYSTLHRYKEDRKTTGRLELWSRLYSGQFSSASDDITSYVETLKSEAERLRDRWYACQRHFAKLWLYMSEDYIAAPVYTALYNIIEELKMGVVRVLIWWDWSTIKALSEHI